MIIIKYFSDLHLEFGNPYILDELFNDSTADLFVIAGDLDVGNKTIDTLCYIDTITNGRPVIFVPGNHEYYGTQRVVLDNLLLKARKTFKNVKVLIEGIFEYKDIVFVGSTGWWDSPMFRYHLMSLNDFNRIYDIRMNRDGSDWGNNSRLFFETTLKEYVGYKRVICISHNAPSWKSINEEYENSSINECFANHWDYLIEKYCPIAWIHGHMHDSCSYMIGDTKILCNPYGYHNHIVNREFDRTAYLEVQ